MKIICFALLSTLSVSATFGAPILPVLNAPLSDLTREINGSSDSIPLNDIFGTEEVDDQIVRFTTQSTIGSLTLDIALFSDRTPGTRTNFLNYVNDGDFDNSIIHRSVPGFVIQGGGFYDSNSSGNYFLEPIPTDPAIVNEFGVSNTLGTVSMAKLSGNPDSATSGWFISIGDNSANLDNQNGGFTVFGKITKGTLINAQSIGNPNDFPIWNAGNAFTNLPLKPDYDGSRRIEETDFVLFTSVELVDIPISEVGTSTALTYSVLQNSNPAVVTASISANTNLVLDYTGSIAGSSTITIRAIDSVGNTVDDTFTVSINVSNFENWQQSTFSTSELSKPEVSGPDADHNNDGLSNLELYLHNLSNQDVQMNPVIFTESFLLGKSYPTFTFPILNTINDIDFTVEQNNDLRLTEDWVAVPHTEISRITDGIIDTVSVRTTSASSGDNEFYRVRFNQLP